MSAISFVLKNVCIWVSHFCISGDRKSTRLNSSHTEIYTLFPTRRSSDLNGNQITAQPAGLLHERNIIRAQKCLHLGIALLHLRLDRKSTRLNSSHANTSYAVFCLQK